MFILFLSVSFVSFRQCKVTAIFFRFQEISQILLQLVWTNAPSLDKSWKQAQKLSKGNESYEYFQYNKSTRARITGLDFCPCYDTISLSIDNKNKKIANFVVYKQ